MDVAGYLYSRVTTLKPPPRVPNSANVFAVAARMTSMQWLMFSAGWLAWIVDAYDVSINVVVRGRERADLTPLSPIPQFFTVSLTVGALSISLDVSTAQVTTAITLTLLLRCVEENFLSLTPGTPQLTFSPQLFQICRSCHLWYLL